MIYFDHFLSLMTIKPCGWPNVDWVSSCARDFDCNKGMEKWWLDPLRGFSLSKGRAGWKHNWAILGHLFGGTVADRTVASWCQDWSVPKIQTPGTWWSMVMQSCSIAQPADASCQGAAMKLSIVLQQDILWFPRPWFLWDKRRPNISELSPGLTWRPRWLNQWISCLVWRWFSTEDW